MKTYDELITNLKDLIRNINPEFTHDKRISDQYLLCEMKNLLEMSKLNSEKFVNEVDKDFKQKILRR